MINGFLDCEYYTSEHHDMPVIVSCEILLAAKKN